MPRGNGTGPDGMGPMTGRRLGYCAESDEPGFKNDQQTPRVGRRFGRGPGWRNGLGNRRGYGRGGGIGLDLGRRGGFKHRPAWTLRVADSDELQPLVEQVSSLKRQIAALEAQIASANDNDALNRPLDGD